MRFLGLGHNYWTRSQYGWSSTPKNLNKGLMANMRLLGVERQSARAYYLGICPTIIFGRAVHWAGYSDTNVFAVGRGPVYLRLRHQLSVISPSFLTL